MDLRDIIVAGVSNRSSLFYSDGREFSDPYGTFNRLCTALQSLELKPGAVVGIRMPKGPEYFLCILACMAMGIAYVPLANSFPESRIQEIREDSGLCLILDAGFVSDALAANYTGAVDWDALPSVPESDPLYIIFTSGSTGRPKGVVISRRAFDRYASWLDTYLSEVTDADRVLQITEFTFDISLIDVVLYIWKKTALYFTGFDGVIFKLAKEISDFKITTISTVPNNVNMLLEKFIAEKSDLSSLSTLMIGGARFSYGLYQKVGHYLHGKSIHNFYGPTEFTIYSHAKALTFDELRDCEDHNVSIGLPNTSVQAWIYADGEFLANGQRGELLLSGDQIMTEYINNREKTSSVLLQLEGQTYYRTGDLAYRNGHNEFFVVGRLDDTIKYRGYRINLLDVDSYTQRLPYIQDVTTIAVPDEIRENITVAYVILKNEFKEKVTVKQVKQDLADVLVEYQIPEKVRFIESFPVNISGKVCKKQLAELYAAGG